MSELATSARSTVRVAAAVVITLPLVLSLVYLGGYLAGAPAEREVLRVGHMPVAAEVVSPSLPQVYGPLVPSTSLSTIRCEAWSQRHPGPCPDEATLAAAYWPQVEQAPQTVYAGILSTCDTAPEHFNVEYFQGILTIHCHTAGRLAYVWQGPPHSDSRAEVVSVLVTIPSAGMQPGPLWIYREDRVERWISDIVTQNLIGLVTIGEG